jgi:hypothetical protein
MYDSYENDYEHSPEYQAYEAEREMWDDASRAGRTVPADDDHSFIAEAQRRAQGERPEPEYHWDTDMCNYHRNAQGRWVVIGPAELVIEGQCVDVRTKAGKIRSEEVLGAGEPFDFRGRPYRYGYIAQRPNTYRRRNVQRGSYASQEDAAQSYNRQYGRAV